MLLVKESGSSMAKIIHFLTISALLVFTYSPSSFSEDLGKESIPVGVVVPLTGDQSLVGEALKNSLILANEKIENGRKYKLIIEDDEWMPAKTVSAVNKLISLDKVKFIFVFGTNQGSAVVDIIDRAGIPFFSLNINPSVARDRNQTFIMFPNINALTNLNIKEAKRRGYKKIVTVSTLQDSCLLQQEVFDRSGEFEILKSLELPIEDRQMRDIAVKIKSLSPDAVFLSTIPPQGANLARRLREIGFKGEFFGGIQEYRKESLANSKGALLNAWFVAGDDSKASDFYSEYVNRFGVDARDYSRFAVYAYDGLFMLDQAILSGDVLNYMRTLKGFHGASGEISSDEASGFDFPVVVKELR